MTGPLDRRDIPRMQNMRTATGRVTCPLSLPVIVD
jgi:hypothetical protein